MSDKLFQSGCDRVPVYVVDDHPVVRKGLSEYINESDDFIVCGSAGDAEAALREINELEPEVVIVDIVLQGTGGLDLVRAVKERHRGIRAIVHSMHEGTTYVERAVRAGADGYVVKSEPIEQVLVALRRVLKGQRYLNDSLKDQLLDKFIGDREADMTDPVETLTNREFEVFQRIAEGKSIHEIALSLHLSEKTVQTYRDRIKEKLGLEKSRDLVHFAFQWKESSLR